jgi:cytochrome c2
MVKGEASMMERRRTWGRKSASGLCLVCALELWVGVGTVMAGVEEGRKIFEEKNCITCHSLGDEKGAAAQFGGPLDHIGVKLHADWLKSYLRDPQSKMPESKMPKENLSDKELDDLVAYLLSLK